MDCSTTNVKLQIRRNSLSTLPVNSSAFNQVPNPSNLDSDVIMKSLEEVSNDKTSSSDTIGLAEIVKDESGAAGHH